MSGSFVPHVSFWILQGSLQTKALSPGLQKEKEKENKKENNKIREKEEGTRKGQRVPLSLPQRQIIALFLPECYQTE